MCRGATTKGMTPLIDRFVTVRGSSHFEKQCELMIPPDFFVIRTQKFNLIKDAGFQLFSSISYPEIAPRLLMAPSFLD